MTLAEHGRAHQAGRLWIESSSQGTSRVLILAGDLESDSCPYLESELIQAELSDAARIVLDLGGLDFIDSTGIGLLLAAVRRSEQDSNRLWMVPSRNEDVQRLIQLCGLEGHMPFAEEASGGGAQ